MSSKEFSTRIRMKRDTSSNWVANNPVLLDGEIVIVDTDAGEVRYKVGDGTKKFSQLPFTDESMLNLVNNKQDKLTIDASPASGSPNPVASGGVKDYAVPMTRTINGKSLSEDITLSATDVGADESGSAAQALKDAKSYTDTKITTVEGTISALSSNVTSTYETKEDAEAKLESANDYTDSAVSGKADTNHDHDGRYYTETETNTLIASLETKSDASAKLTEAKSYTDTQISDLATSASVNTKISTHNTATNSHSDIRTQITDLAAKLNNFLDVDEETTNQLSEVLAMIEANDGSIGSLTSSKVNVSDIVNDLTTNSTTKVLSAAQGVQIQSLINTVDSALDTHIADKSNPHSVTKAQVGLGNVDNTADASKPVSTAQATAIADAKSAGTQAQTNLTMHINNKSNPHGVTAAQTGALPLTGGTMTGEIVIGQNDGKGIQVGTNGRINATTSDGSTTATICGVNGTSVLLGHSSFSTTLRGKASNPTYNGANLALYSDITNVGDARYVQYATNTSVSVAGTTKSTYTHLPPSADSDAGTSSASAYFPEGIVMGGTAGSAGLMARGICGITTPNATTGACSKENLFLNYDGSDTYSSTRQVVIQAGSVGTHYGHNLYQYAAARGDAVKSYCDANYINVAGDAMSGTLAAEHGLSWKNASWIPSGNIVCTPTANNQEWSFDVGASGYTGCYWHVWSAINSKSMLACYADDNKVTVPSGNLEVAGTVKVGNAVTLKYDSTNECLNFAFA